MAAYDLEEQEQLDELKTWWKMYGNLVTGILVALALAAVAWQGWNWWQRQQSVQASALYSGLQTAATQKDAKRARAVAGELIDIDSATSYAALGALLAALTRSLRMALSGVGFCSAPAFAFSGVAFPLLAMPASARLPLAIGSGR